MSEADGKKRILVDGPVGNETVAGLSPRESKKMRSSGNKKGTSSGWHSLTICHHTLSNIFVEEDGIPLPDTSEGDLINLTSYLFNLGEV